jgi:UDP-N-acetylglucosamine transferase subunit ALG13
VTRAELPLVLVTIGTDHHTFDRLIGWCEQWAQAHPYDATMFVQHGSSRAPIGIEASDRVSRERLRLLMESAAVIVTHGGGGSITQCWEAGQLPIVVPRSSRLGEHVDEHQEAFGSRLAEMGYAHIARTYDELDAALVARLTATPHESPAIDFVRPTKTTEAIGQLIDVLVANRRNRHRTRSRNADR